MNQVIPGRHLKRILTILLIFIIHSTMAHAEETKKISIAIMEFRANNTEESYGKASMDMLSQKLYATDLFTVMEKSQLDRIAMLNGFKEFNMIDPEQIARMGKVLNVDKLIVGSISYIDSFIINVKVFNSITGEVEYDVVQKIFSIENLEKAIEEISFAIERHYLGYKELTGDFDLTIEMLYLYPFDLLGQVVDTGNGIQASFQFNSIFKKPSINLLLITGFYSFTPFIDYSDFTLSQNSDDYFYMFPLYTCFSHKYIITRNISIIPSAGIGYIFSKIYSEYDPHSESLYWDRNRIYHNPSILLRTELDVYLHDRWYIVFTPQYSVFFEKDRAGQFLSIGIGLKMLF